MKKYLIIGVLLLFSLHATAATRTASVSGNSNDTATWGGADVPVSGDTVNINGDIVVTIPSGVTHTWGATTVGATANSSGISTLINNGTLNIDSGARLRIGTGTGKDGNFTFGPDSTTNVTNTGFSWDNCQIRSTATRDHPAKLTGAAPIDYILAGTQDIQISNVSFQTTGAISLRPLSTPGAQTPQIDISNCVFYGASSLTFGATTTPNTVPITVSNSDIRELGLVKTVTFRRVDGGAAAYSMTGCTLYQSSGSINVTPTTSSGLTISGNVFHGAYITTSSPSACIISDNYFSMVNAGGYSIRIQDDSANTVSGNYFRSVCNNYWPIRSNGSAGSGTHIISGNILDGLMDGVTWTDRADFYFPGATSIGASLSGNIAINSDFIVHVLVTADRSIPITAKNNTISTTVSSAVDVGGAFWSMETDDINTGTINVANNVVFGNGSAGNFGFLGTSSGVKTQVISSSDYNAFYDITTPYSSTRLTISAGQTNDTTTINPNFIDPNRDIGKWNLNFGSGTDSGADAITHLLSKNGYRGTPNFDQGGSTIECGPDHLVEWVSYGFSPTNGALRHAGDDGSTIGAVEWQNPRRKR